MVGLGGFIRSGFYLAFDLYDIPIAECFFVYRQKPHTCRKSKKEGSTERR